MSHNVYKGKPEEGKVYALTGGPKAACIANGNTWAESEIMVSRVVCQYLDKSTVYSIKASTLA